MKFQYKSVLRMVDGLETALKQERNKYASHPVLPDMVPDHVNAQGWCYVVAGYFLLEMAFKALLQARGSAPPVTHSLSTLFKQLDEGDQNVLREFYSDYQLTIGGRVGAFPMRSLDECLMNLDGDRHKAGGTFGSFDWRYCLIENGRSEQMPFVCVDYLHEVVYGCVQILVFVENGCFPPEHQTHSYRLRRDRKCVYDRWLDAQMLSDDWRTAGERWIVLWGPDHRGRFDLVHCVENGYSEYFEEWPADSEMPVYDMRREVSQVLEHEDWPSTKAILVP